MDNLKSRRAVLLGSATTFAVAAVPAVAAGSPDAELIAVCAEFDALYQKTLIIHDGPDAIEDDDEAAAAVAPLWRRMDALLDRMDTLRAATQQGIHARARTLALNASKGWHNGWFSLDYRQTVPARLLSYLMRDAAALASAPSAAAAITSAGTTATAPPNPDAALIAACVQFDALESQAKQVMAGAGTIEEEQRREPIEDALKDQQEPLLRTICTTRATTPEGCRAKARTLAFWGGTDLFHGSEAWDAQMIGSLLRDMAGEVLA